MADIKTKPSHKSVEEFLNQVPNERRRRDSFTILELMKRITQLEPVLWGDSIIGFGSYHYQYDSGREGDMPLVGFSPRKQALTLYLSHGFEEFDSLLGRLGKYKTSKACLYINKLEDVSLPVLEELIKSSFEYKKATNPR